MNNTAKLGLLLPAVLNPATAAVIGIAASAVGLYRMLPDEVDEATVEPAQIKRLPPPVPIAAEPLSTVELDEDASEVVANEVAPAPTTSEDQKEMIRSAMSELGKRSAAARAKKKAERQELAS